PGDTLAVLRRDLLALRSGLADRLLRRQLPDLDLAEVDDGFRVPGLQRQPAVRVGPLRVLEVRGGLAVDAHHDPLAGGDHLPGEPRVRLHPDRVAEDLVAGQHDPGPGAGDLRLVAPGALAAELEEVFREPAPFGLDEEGSPDDHTAVAPLVD